MFLSMLALLHLRLEYFLELVYFIKSFSIALLVLIPLLHCLLFNRLLNSHVVVLEVSEG